MLRFYTYFSITLSSTNIREKRWSWMYRYTYGLLPALCSHAIYIFIYLYAETGQCEIRPPYLRASKSSSLIWHNYFDNENLYLHRTTLTHKSRNTAVPRVTA